MIDHEPPPPGVLGAAGPGIWLDHESARELWPAVRAHAVELHQRGARTRLGRLARLLEAWQWIAVTFTDESGSSVVVAGRASSSHAPLIDSATAAELLGCSRQHVTDLCRRREIDGARVGRVWAIDRASVERHRHGDT